MQYKVTLKKDNTEFMVDENETILDAALAQGYRLAYGCKNARCFGCLQEIESGEVEYRREIQDVGDLLKYQSMLCQAYPKSDVVINGQQMPDLTADEPKSAAPSEGQSKAKTDAVPTESTAGDKNDDNNDSDNASVANTANQADEEAPSTHQQPIVVSTFPVKVIASERLNEEVQQIDLALPERIGFAFIPGQYLDVLLDNGERRSFSIAHYDEEKHQITIYIKYIAGGYFSDYVFSHLTLGTIWTVEAPLGPFILQDSERPVLMIGTSTGISPLYAMLQALKNGNESRAFSLYWGVRYPSYLFLDDTLKKLADDVSQLDYTPVVSRPDDNWSGATGYPQHIAIEAIKDLSQYDIYISGGQQLIDDAVSSLLSAGAVRTQIYLDVFSFQSHQA